MKNLWIFLITFLAVSSCREPELTCNSQQELVNGECVCQFSYYSANCENEIRERYYGYYHGYVELLNPDSVIALDSVVVNGNNLSVNQFNLNMEVIPNYLIEGKVTIHSVDSAWYEWNSLLEGNLIGPILLYDDSLFGYLEDTWSGNEVNLFLSKY